MNNLEYPLIILLKQLIQNKEIISDTITEIKRIINLINEYKKKMYIRRFFSIFVEIIGANNDLIIQYHPV